MRLIVLLILLWATPMLLAEEVCGLYMRDDFSRGVLESLTDFTSNPEFAVTYSFEQPLGVVAQSLISGMCYCLGGPTGIDLKFSGDAAFRTLRVDTLVSGPTRDCVPAVLRFY